MGRRPHENQSKHQNALDADAAGGDGPANHRREGTGRATDNDVLRGPALEPHGVDNDIEEDRESQKPCCHKVTGEG